MLTILSIDGLCALYNCKATNWATPVAAAVHIYLVNLKLETMLWWTKKTWNCQTSTGIKCIENLCGKSKHSNGAVIFQNPALVTKLGHSLIKLACIICIKEAQCIKSCNTTEQKIAYDLHKLSKTLWNDDISHAALTSMLDPWMKRQCCHSRRTWRSWTSTLETPYQHRS